MSGDDLVGSAAIQAIRLGARLNAPCDVVGLRIEDGLHVVVLADNGYMGHVLLHEIARIS